MLPLLGAKVRKSSCVFKDHTTLRISTSCNQSVVLALPEAEFNQWTQALRSITTVAETVVDDFQVMHKIGKGGYAKVYRAHHVGGQTLALKVLQKPLPGYVRQPGGVKSTQLKFLVQERSALQMLKHPHITSLHHAFQDDQYLYMTMGLMDGGSLFEVGKRMPARRFPERLIKVWCAQVVSALAYAHTQKFIHRDLKPENVLLDENNNAHLADFGLSCYVAAVDGVTKLSKCGTPEYMSPEMISGKAYDYSVDWWALGIFMFELFSGRSPFANSSRDVQRQNIVRAQLKFPSSVNMSSSATSIITELLRKDPKVRIDIDGIRAHPFFEGIDWTAVDNGSMPPVDFNNPIMGLDRTTDSRHSFVSSSKSSGGGLLSVVGFHYSRRAEMNHRRRSIPSITKSACESWSQSRAPTRNYTHGLHHLQF